MQRIKLTRRRKTRKRRKRQRKRRMEKEVIRKKHLEVETMNFDDRMSNPFLSVQEGIQS